MKSILLISWLLMSVVLTLSAQEKKEKQATPPAAVKDAFTKAFPGASAIIWEKEKRDFEVNFTAEGKKLSAVYDGKGNLKETEENIPVESLPAAALDYIHLHYKGAAIKETAKITKPGGAVSFEAEVNKKDLLFAQNGAFLKEETDAD